MILQHGPSDHCLCSWPLGRGSGVERTVPFFTCLRECAKRPHSTKGALCLPQELSSNPILKVRGVISVYSRGCLAHQTLLQNSRGSCLGPVFGIRLLTHSAVFPIRDILPSSSAIHAPVFSPRLRFKISFPVRIIL